MSVILHVSHGVYEGKDGNLNAEDKVNEMQNGGVPMLRPHESNLLGNSAHDLFLSAEETRTPIRHQQHEPTMVQKSPLLIAAYLLTLVVCQTKCFSPIPALTNTRYFLPSLRASANEHMEDMRRALEGSWNTNLMGAVPTSPDSAAEAAGKGRNETHVPTS